MRHGTQVLILLDRSYLHRFWTGFEAWLSFRKVTAMGLDAMDEAERKRHGRTHVAGVYQAPDTAVLTYLLRTT